MGFGSTAKKLQRVTDLAEEVYERLSTLHDQVASLRDTVEDTHARMDALEAEVAANRALLDELAREQGIDPTAVADRPSADDETDTADAATENSSGPGSEAESG